MKTMSFSLICAAALLAAPVPALALALQSAPEATVQIKKNQTLVDADGRVLGKVYEVNTGKGEVRFISQMRIYHVPLATISAEGARLKTSMTRAQIGL